MGNSLTGDYSGDGLNLSAHMTGDPVNSGTGSYQPSAGVSWCVVVGAVALLALLWFVFKTVRI